MFIVDNDTIFGFVKLRHLKSPITGVQHGQVLERLQNAFANRLEASMSVTELIGGRADDSHSDSDESSSSASSPKPEDPRVAKLQQDLEQAKAALADVTNEVCWAELLFCCEFVEK